MNGNLSLELERGQLRTVKPGAGRMLGLLSVTELPRRLALDFRDVTDEVQAAGAKIKDPSKKRRAMSAISGAKPP